jgi:hypothetical protein
MNIELCIKQIWIWKMRMLDFMSKNRTLAAYLTHFLNDFAK